MREARGREVRVKLGGNTQVCVPTRHLVVLFFVLGLNMNQKDISKNISINASPWRVWEALTTPELLEGWMSDVGIEMNVTADWKIGGLIVFTGKLHGTEYLNKGRILNLEIEKSLEYSYWSSISQIPDTPANYSLIEYHLIPSQNQTLLRFSLRNFPTESIYKHSHFYWNVALEKLKDLLERGPT
jgi:uncharacterized protein YndB with AHSA1/START domain